MNNSILLVDDHSIIRSGIKALLKDNLGIENIHEASTECEVIRLVKATSYDLILLDINMPGSDFVNLITWLNNLIPETPILVFTMYTEEIYGKRCLQLGAKGFLHKIAPDEEIITAIKKVLNGGSYINAKLQQLLSESGKEHKKENPFEELSTRELEIAILINKGYTLLDICKELNIQYSTASTYKRRVFEKLDVPNSISLTKLMQLFKIED